VYSFSSLFTISFLVHLLFVCLLGVFYNFSEISNKTPKKYRFISVNWETDKIKKRKKRTNLLSNIDREEKGFFLKNRKIQIQKSSRRIKNISGIEISQKKNISNETEKNIEKKSSISNIKSKKVLNILSSSNNKKRKLKLKNNTLQVKKMISEKKLEPKKITDRKLKLKNNTLQVKKMISEKKLEPKKIAERKLKSNLLKLENDIDRLKLFRVDQKHKKSFEVSEIVLDKMASLDSESKKKNKDDQPISLSTSKTKYFRYFKHLKEKIEESWAWWAPEARGLNGELKLQFTLLRDGSLKKIDLLKSSGYEILDDEAISAVTKASFSFRPFPLNLRRKTLVVQGTFEYVSERFFVRKFLRN